MALNERISTNLLWAKNILAVPSFPIRTVKQFGFPDFHYKIIDEPGLDYPNAIVTVKDRYLPVVAQNFLEYCLPTVAALQAEAAASSEERSCIPRGIQLLSSA